MSPDHSVLLDKELILNLIKGLNENIEVAEVFPLYHFLRYVE